MHSPGSGSFTQICIDFSTTLSNQLLKIFGNILISNALWVPKILEQTREKSENNFKLLQGSANMNEVLET